MASIATLVDRVKIVVLSSGTGPFDLGQAVPGYRGVEALNDGSTYNYATENGANYEVGVGVYLLSSNTLVRSPQISSNGGAAVNFPANIELSFTVLAADIVATGGTFPIANSTGSAPDVAISQLAATSAINTVGDALADFQDNLAATTGAAFVGSDDGAAGSLWTTVADFIAYLKSSVGSSIIGFLQSGANAIARTVQSKLRDGHVSPEDFGAVGDGTTDDTVALQRALDTGRYVRGVVGKVYAFGTQLTPPAGGGFDGIELLMLTGSGKFDASTYTGGKTANKTGILVNAKANARVIAKITMQTNASVRTCNAVSFVSSDFAKIDVEATGFKEAQFGVVSIDSCLRPIAYVKVHDCGADTTSLGSMQITGCCVDADRVGGVNTIAPLIVGYFKNIRLGSTAGAFYGEQTDGLNIQTTGYSGAHCTVYADNVGEPFDNFGDFVYADIICQNAVNYGVKLIHGASSCVINATINGVGIYGVVLGSDSTTKSVNRNIVNATVSGAGSVANPVPPAITAAFGTDGSSATFQPTNNVVNINCVGVAPAQKFLAYLESGSGNLITIDGTPSFATQFATVAGSAGVNNIVRRKQNTHVRAHIGTATTVTNNATVPFDTETLDPTNEYNPSTQTLTVNCAGRYRCFGQIRALSVATLQGFGLGVIVSGSLKARSVPINPAASGQEVWAVVDTIVDCAAGDTILFRCITTVAGSVTVTNDAQYSFMQVEQL